MVSVTDWPGVLTVSRPVPPIEPVPEKTKLWSVAVTLTAVGEKLPVTLTLPVAAPVANTTESPAWKADGLPSKYN